MTRKKFDYSGHGFKHRIHRSRKQRNKKAANKAIRIFRIKKDKLKEKELENPKGRVRINYL